MPDTSPTAAGVEEGTLPSGREGVDASHRSMSSLSTASAAASGANPAEDGDDLRAIYADTNNDNGSTTNPSHEAAAEADNATTREASSFHTNRALSVSPFLAAKGKKTERAGRGKRVAIKKSAMLGITDDDDHRACIPSDWPNSAWLYGTILSGTSHKGWKVSVDIFPASKKTVEPVKKPRFVILGKEDEEPPFNLDEYLAGEDEGEIDLEGADPSKRKTSPAQKSFDDFDMLAPEVRKTAKTFKYYFKDGTAPAAPVIWDIVADGEIVKGKEIDLGAAVGLRDDFTIKEFENPDSPTEDKKVGEGSFHGNFFKHMMPSIVGHAEIIDNYHKDTRSPQYSTVKNRKIKFHDSGAADPDHKVKKCYTLISHDCGCFICPGRH